ncbi:MAG: TatD family deoxyribonuclease [Alphaproteobacteria bacterium]|nr:MAG: TatD family deoxyribonuclease [Alphaproteobacteria bacterium]
MLVDSHCHLDFPDLFSGLPDVLRRAEQMQVGTMLTISTKMSTFQNVRAIAESTDNVFCTVGIHPHEAENDADVTTEQLIDLAKHPKVVGIGETGLDYYYDNSPRELQQALFRRHIAASRETGLPLIVHTRDADDDTVAILQDEYAKGAFGGLIHCFSASDQLAKDALDIGFYISVSGIATFKTAEPIRETLKSVPLDRLLVETDAPFLAPVPHRGKTNEPSFVPHTAAKLAEIKGVDPDTLADATTDNFFRLFTKAVRPL